MLNTENDLSILSIDTDTYSDINDIKFLAKNLPFAHNQQTPSCKGNLRYRNSDFKVLEILSFEPCGFGEHLFLQIEKQSSNTDWVIRQLIKKSGLTRKDIGYAGKKDRHSISRQWFSLHLPGKTELIDTKEYIDQLNGDGYQVVNHIRHNKKLRIGSILRNDFKIILRELSENIETSKVEKIRRFGFPNYFGYQRFGHDYNNLNLANELLTGGMKINNRNKRGLVLSSARSYLFNLQLASRVRENNWNSELDGDCFMLNQSRSYFFNKDPNDSKKFKNEKNLKEQKKDIDEHVTIEKRLEGGDIHICGWLPGKQLSESTLQSKELEDKANNKMSGWIDGLSKLGIDSSRRSYRTIAVDLKCVQTENIATISFSLPSGSYATGLLRELVDFKDLSLERDITN
ncbi:MAG: tRNA pseudouridine13 synthase [Polaribacter sp.]|jgi:tRNA pseudouridine13 synthase